MHYKVASSCIRGAMFSVLLMTPCNKLQSNDCTQRLQIQGTLLLSHIILTCPIIIIVMNCVNE